MNMREKMRAASQSFQLLWLKLMQNDPPAEVLALANLLAMQMKCTDWVGLYRWFESIPLMRRWLGDRKVKELKGAGHQVTQDYFESTIGVQREDVRYDKLGGYMTAIEKLANEIKLLPWRQAVAVLADGFSGTAFQLCFDGLPLFSAEHSTGSNTSTLALSATNLATAKKVMRAQADPETGDSLLIEPTHLWYHTALEPTAIEIVEKEFITAGESSVSRSSASPRPPPTGGASSRSCPAIR